MLALYFALALQAQAVPAESGEVHLRNIRQLTFGGQNAEAYWSGDGRRLILQRQPADTGCDHTYIMNADGSDLREVASGKGRNTCGFFFDHDRRIFYSSTEHADPACPPRPDYSQGYVWALYDYDIYVAAADGAHARRLTTSPGYDAEGTLSPDGRTIFASNWRDPRSRNFDLYLVNLDGSGLEQVTTSPEFDAFPMFSPDGSKVVWASNRHGSKPGETNVFVADWIDRP